MPAPSQPAVTVVGVGADGAAGMAERTWARVLSADVVVGGARHLAMLPDTYAGDREPWPSPLRDGLPELFGRQAGRDVVVLASGDPFVSGVATTLVDLLGAEAVRVLPAASSVALARARMGWSAGSCAVVTVVGRDPRAVLRELAPGWRVLVLTSDADGPAQVADLLVEQGYGASWMTVLGDLGSDDESRASSAAAQWRGPGPALNMVALELTGPLLGSWAGGLPDDAFEHDGQLTKRDLRASALARLAPVPEQLLWDVGAGAGSVGIEWLRAHPSCAAVAVEADPERAARIARNAGRLGVPRLDVRTGSAPQALGDLPAPDAVFVGGGATVPGLVDRCREALRPGGRLVVHGVTLETEALLAAAYAAHGGELTRIAVEQAAPIGSFTGWSPARTVTQWSWRKP